MVDDITRMRRKKNGQCPEHGNDLVPYKRLVGGKTVWACDIGLFEERVCDYSIVIKNTKI